MRIHSVAALASFALVTTAFAQTVADAEAWAKTFDYGAILGVIDPR